MTYIERKALLEKRQTVGICDAVGNYYGAADVVFVDDIEAAPAADVVPVKHGRWEFKHNPIDDPKGYFIRIVCSECNLHTGQKSNFCPNCGADMRED